jgi:hypothetical protein
MLKTLHETTCFLCSTQDHQRDSSFRVLSCVQTLRAHTHTHKSEDCVSVVVHLDSRICNTCDLKTESVEQIEAKIAHDFCELKALHVFAGSQCRSDVGDMTFLKFFSQRTP